LKLLLVLGHPNPFPGAAWARIGFLAEAWYKKGHVVEVLGAFGPRSFRKRGATKLEAINTLNLVFNMSVTNPAIFVINTAISFLTTSIVLFIRRPNLVVVSVPPGDVGLGAIAASRIVKTRCVVDVRDEWEDFAASLATSRLGKGFFHLVKRIANLVYATSELVVGVTPPIAAALESRGVTGIRLMPNGADLGVFHPKPVLDRSTRLTLVYTGHIGSYYRLDLALKALKRLKDVGVSKLRLVIAGTGDIGVILKLAQQLGISSSVVYKGSITGKRRLGSIMALAQAGLIPYDDNPLWRNTLPAKFFEYCACGLPVIAMAYDDSVLADLIKENGVGLVVPPLNEQELAAAIYKMYRDSLFRTNAGKKARELVLREFDRQKLADRFLKAIKGICETSLPGKCGQ
jgi:glycosyltransferase involved in cell wall biosynthesis